MRKLFIALTFLGFMATANVAFATPNTATTVASSIVQDEEAPAQSASFTQELKKRFIEGGP